MLSLIIVVLVLVVAISMSVAIGMYKEARMLEQAAAYKKEQQYYAMLSAQWCAYYQTHNSLMVREYAYRTYRHMCLVHPRTVMVDHRYGTPTWDSVAV